MRGLVRQIEEIGAIAAAVETTQPPTDILMYLPGTLIGRAAQIVRGRTELGGQDSTTCSARIERTTDGRPKTIKHKTAEN